MAGIERWLAAGIAPGDPGQRRGEEPGAGAEACRAFPGRIAVGIDARDGFVATEGWAETSPCRASTSALRFEDAGVAAIIYTDIGRDGMLSGLNLTQTVALARAAHHAGDRLRRGRLRWHDLVALKHGRAPGTRIEGVIVGRAAV